MTTGPMKPGARYVLFFSQDEMDALMTLIDAAVRANGLLAARVATPILAECDHASTVVEQFDQTEAADEPAEPSAAAERKLLH